jgi:hypothetical protein
MDCIIIAIVLFLFIVGIPVLGLIFSFQSGSHNDYKATKIEKAFNQLQDSKDFTYYSDFDNQFKDYIKYDQENPDRFEVKYDKDGNRS